MPEKDPPQPERIACPHCRKKVPYRGPGANFFFPFCSERCKLLDLGMWLNEEHRIGSEPDAE